MLTQRGNVIMEIRPNFSDVHSLPLPRHRDLTIQLCTTYFPVRRNTNECLVYDNGTFLAGQQQLVVTPYNQKFVSGRSGTIYCLSNLFSS